MEFSISVGDQEAYHRLVAEATIYLESLSNQLAVMYNELDGQQPVDIVNLGSATEAIVFATERLKEQKNALESYRQQLRKDISSNEER